MTFAFNLQEKVMISVSGETGTIIGRAEYSAGENSYFLRYGAADGRAVEAWWAESALQKTSLSYQYDPVASAPEEAPAPETTSFDTTTADPTPSYVGRV